MSLSACVMIKCRACERTTAVNEARKCHLCKEFAFCQSCEATTASKLICCSEKSCAPCLASKLLDCENCRETRCIECLLGGCTVGNCDRLICDACLRDCSTCKEQFCFFHLHKVRLIGQLKSVYVCADCFMKDCEFGHMHDPVVPPPSVIIIRPAQQPTTTPDHH